MPTWEASWQEKIKQGQYVLYNYTTGEEAGLFEVNELGYSTMSVNIFANAVSGMEPVYDREYNFEELAIEDFALKLKGRNRKSWRGSQSGHNVILTRLSYKNLTCEITGLEDPEKHYYYLLSVVSDYLYNIVEKNENVTSMTRRNLISNISDVKYSGIIVLE